MSHLVIALLFIMFSPHLFAANELNGDIQNLMQELAQVKSARAKFVEKKYLSILNKPIEFSGTLNYIAPDRLEKHTLLPKPESMILEKDVVTLENKTKNQRRLVKLQEYPVIWAFVESIRSTLAGDLQTLNKFYKVKFQGESKQWRLSMIPIQQEMQDVISEIRIAGNKNRLTTVEILEAGGDRSVMTIQEDGA